MSEKFELWPPDREPETEEVCSAHSDGGTGRSGVKCGCAPTWRCTMGWRCAIHPPPGYVLRSAPAPSLGDMEPLNPETPIPAELPQGTTWEGLICGCVPGGAYVPSGMISYVESFTRNGGGEHLVLHIELVTPAEYRRLREADE